MGTTRDAILNAVAAAARLHRDYGAEAAAEEGKGRIDVFRMLADHKIPFMFRPLSGLLGAFLNDPVPGVLVTSQRPLAVQRFTAAHELGHALLGHQPSLDDADILRRTPFSPRPQYELHEIEADAFAAELLTPRWLIVHHMKQQGWTHDDLRYPATVYQLSLRIGVSYSATCYALQRHKAIDGSCCQRLLQVQPRSIKRELAEGVQPANWYGDVWVLTERDDGLLLEGSRTDLVVVKLPEHSGSGFLWRLDEFLATGLRVLNDIRSADSSTDAAIGSHVTRRVTVQPIEIAKGHARLTEVRPWQPSDPVQVFTLGVDLFGPVSAGLLPAEREQLLGVA